MTGCRRPSGRSRSPRRHLELLVLLPDVSPHTYICKSVQEQGGVSVQV